MTFTLKTTDAQTGQETEHTLESKQLTVLCHQGGMELEALDSDVVTITATDTIAFMDTVSPEDWEQIRTDERFAELFKKVFEFDPPVKLVSMDTKHVAGLLCLIAKAFALGKRPFLKLPETYLHPKQVAQLADVLVKLSNGK